MFKSLLLTQLQAVFYTMFAAKSTGKKKTLKGTTKKVLIGLLAVYVIASMFFFFGFITSQLSSPLIGAGLITEYFVLIGLMAFLLMFIGSVFLTEKQLYEARDNELLISMPIPSSHIILSRMISILLINIMYGSMTLIPAGFMYFYETKSFSVITLFFMIIGGLLLSVLSLMLSAVGGFLIASIISNLKRKKLFSTVFMLAFFFAVMGFYMNLQKVMSTLVLKGAALSDALRKVFPPLFFYGKSIAEKDVLSLAILFVITVAPTALIIIKMSTSFIKIATKKKGSANKYRYKEKQLAVGSPRKALLIKEAKKFFSTPTYLMNAGLGSIVILIFAVAIVIKGPSIITSISQLVTNGAVAELPFHINSFLPVMVGGVLAFCTSTNITTSSSLSLEGKSFPLLKSMPLKFVDIVLPKILFNLVWGFIPVLIASAVSLIRLRISFISVTLILLTGLVCQAFTAVWGMLCNVFFNKFDWV
ncbi:MAG TPA: hypothetical protein VFC76_02620, partial [Oscillospiraceae bacterium]|nr:hypothetical protein [Oscillospiraceae bacterium]